MISGRSSETTYEQTENLKPGKTSSVTAAPPSTCRRSSTSTLRPGARQVGGVDEPVVAAADDDDVVVRHCDADAECVFCRSLTCSVSAFRVRIVRFASATARLCYIPPMPIGTAVHARTFALCESLNFREWSGYYAVSAYESHHEHEYNAIRNAAALIDVSPLFKYLITGPDAARLVDRVITRDVSKMAVGQVFYTPWCDEHGKVIDDGTVSRLGGAARSAGPPPIRACAGSGRTPPACDVSDRGHLGTGRGARAAGPDVGAAAAGGRRRRHRQPEVLPGDERHDRRRAGRHLAHRLHRRPRLRDLDAVGTTPCGSGTR